MHSLLTGFKRIVTVAFIKNPCKKCIITDCNIDCDKKIDFELAIRPHPAEELWYKKICAWAILVVIFIIERMIMLYLLYRVFIVKHPCKSCLVKVMCQRKNVCDKNIKFNNYLDTVNLSEEGLKTKRILAAAALCILFGPYTLFQLLPELLKFIFL